MAIMKKFKTLNDAQKYKFWEWLKANIREISTEKYGYDVVVKRASMELGFEISEATLAAAVANGVIPAWKCNKGGGLKLNQRLTLLERAFGRLCAKLGEDAAEFLAEQAETVVESPTVAAPANGKPSRVPT